MRSAFSYDTDQVSQATGLDFSVPDGIPNHPSISRTQQSAARDTDINVMFARFMQTGVLPPGRQPLPPDMQVFEQVFDFQSAMNAIVQGERAFASLDSRLRAVFSNDPGQYLAALDAANRGDESARLLLEGVGAVKPLQTPTPAPVPAPSGSPAADPPA